MSVAARADAQLPAVRAGPPGLSRNRLRHLGVGRPTGVHAGSALATMAARLAAALARVPGRERPVAPDALADAEMPTFVQRR
jgi:hypothetical protein